MSSIPLLPTAEQIIEKYSQHSYVLDGKGVLPVLTNQKSNAYLKEIADVCGAWIGRDLVPVRCADHGLEPLDDCSEG